MTFSYLLNKRACGLPEKLVGAWGTAHLVRHEGKLRLSLGMDSAEAKAVVLAKEHHRPGQIFTQTDFGVLAIVPISLALVSEHLALYDQHHHEQQPEE